MSHPGKLINVLVDGDKTYQRIDGFGVNINSKYWNDGKLIPTLELLVDDLGARLFRVDIWGKSNWIDPTSELGPQALSEQHLAKIYGSHIFQSGWAMMRWLNGRGIQPILAASGDVPRWMLAADGMTLADYEAFTQMLASLVEWARKKEMIDFRLFGPLNETDIGSPEGPTVGAQDFVRVCEKLVETLERRGLGDIQLVLPEQAGFNPTYLGELVQSHKLRGSIGVFGMHDYADLPPKAYSGVHQVLVDSPYANVPLWMTEYGDLEQSGEREWYVAWVMTSRLFDHLEGGFSGSLVWDAYDNYHDHDEAWTIYGLLRTGLRVYTPKKRYYATKQVFRFVPPGFRRIAVDCQENTLRVLAFSSKDRSQVTVTGVNQGDHPARLNVQLKGFAESVSRGGVVYYRTSEHENCHTIAHLPVSGTNWPFTGIDALVPPATIFTLGALTG